jgi:hypothetical protein
MSITQELMDAEEVRYLEFDALMDRLSREQKERVGYTERWSAKDVYAHLGCWFAEAMVALEQIRMGTYTPRKLDIEALNEEFYEVWKDQDLSAVEAEFWSSRTRMLQEWGRLHEPNRLAQEWFKESGPNHYDEHLPRLREWVQEITGG